MDIKSIKLEGGKILDLVLWDIVNDYTIKIIIFQFFFLTLIGIIAWVIMDIISIIIWILFLI